MSKEIIGALILGFLFLLAGYWAHEYQQQLELFIGGSGLLSALGYVLFVSFSIVVAPVSTLPLLPIAVAAWGVVGGALLSIAGWVTGSAIIFFVARHIGRPILARFIDLDRAEKIATLASGKHPLVMLTCLRIVVPVDILSYAISLFMNIRFLPYIMTTTIGILPAAFLLAYISSMSLKIQSVLIGLLFLSAAFILIRIRKAAKQAPQESQGE